MYSVVKCSLTVQTSPCCPPQWTGGLHCRAPPWSDMLRRGVRPSHWSCLFIRHLATLESKTWCWSSWTCTMLVWVDFLMQISNPAQLYSVMVFAFYQSFTLLTILKYTCFKRPTKGFQEVGESQIKHSVWRSTRHFSWKICSFGVWT